MQERNVCWLEHASWGVELPDSDPNGCVGDQKLHDPVENVWKLEAFGRHGATGTMQ